MFIIENVSDSNFVFLRGLGAMGGAKYDFSPSTLDVSGGSSYGRTGRTPLTKT